MKLLSKKAAGYILLASITFNLIFIAIDIYPSISREAWEYYESKQKGKISDPVILQESILQKSMEMARGRTTLMPMHDQSFFLKEIKTKLKSLKSTKSTPYFYPKAFLFTGLTDYAISHQDSSLMKEIKKEFNFYIKEDGRPSFEVNIVDQIPFGMAAINFYRFYGEEKYKKMADYMFLKILEWRSEETGLIYYRTDHINKFYYVDTLGMICPFLSRYYYYFDVSTAKVIARNQLDYFINHGIDQDSQLPFHAINIKQGLKVGPTNWGRGIGWYYLAMSEYTKYTRDLFLNETIFELNITLEGLKNDTNTWTQFPGSSEHFDASATVMFLYCILSLQPNHDLQDQVISILAPEMLNGNLLSTSGDTHSINKYSTTFGNSELSHGIFLMTLGLEKNLKTYY
ncbi:hypothetical protein GCM10007049_31510 [Echinicola pacifica]|uniref:Glycosyl Hydrolase Family 88 n=1 Tax=Echinicola pacifica TaxID=346377 RepID=A0A918UUY6_9BACT|nr:glycoside hydrolase family 88 protein [Echinicola pacifica]GGZ35929.1 hypothetical protein GCM10007049_31510 [Echinicola pacifica]